MKNSVNQLKEIAKNAQIQKVAVPEGEDLNTFYQNYGSEGITKLVGEAEEVEKVSTTNIIAAPPQPVIQNSPIQVRGLQVIHSSKLLMEGERNNYYVLGEVSQDMSSMSITLMAEEKETGRKERMKTDLYEKEQVKNTAMQVAQYFAQSEESIERELAQLTDLLEQFREKQLEQVQRGVPFQYKRNHASISAEALKRCMEFLTQKNLIEKIDKLIEQAGVIGEQNSRRLLFIIASTYKMKEPLHALVQGTSGSGKSYLINAIGSCIPPEDIMNMTRVTSKSFYHYNKDELVDKLLLIQDFDGLDEEAQYAFRELQSAGCISSSTTYKDRSGNLISMMKMVRSHFASLLATTKADVHFDNMSRSLIIGVDESDSQTEKIIQYQNKKLAGLIDENKEKSSREFIQNLVRCIKPLNVINPYADKIALPTEAKMLRRLNQHYQSFVRQITLLHQYQRKKDEQGRLITEPEDLQIACDILFDAIMLKIDDLDNSLRHFFDRMKEYIKKQAKGEESSNIVFTQRDVRLALNMSKTQCFRYMEDLEQLEYVQRSGGYANRGFKYKIVFWDDMAKTKQKIKKGLEEQFTRLSHVA
jgi:hypothetical protein